jgi:hypothetical protein
MGLREDKNVARPYGPRTGALGGSRLAGDLMKGPVKGAQYYALRRENRSKKEFFS